MKSSWWPGRVWMLQSLQGALEGKLGWKDSLGPLRVPLGKPAPDWVKA